MIMPPLDPLQYSFQPQLGVEDTIVYLLNSISAHLDKPANTVRAMFFGFSSAFTTLRPALLGELLSAMQVDVCLVSLTVPSSMLVYSRAAD